MMTWNNFELLHYWANQLEVDLGAVRTDLFGDSFLSAD